MIAQRVEFEDDADDARDDLTDRLAGLPYHEERIIVDELQVDHRYQRPISPAWVNKIAKEFDPFLLDPLVVNRRPDGTCYVMDGQHRLAALRQIGYGDQYVPCRVYEGLPIESEARRFDTNANRRPLLPRERFRAALVKGDPEVRIIDAIVRSCGFTINLESGDLEGGRIPAVAALMTIKRQYRAGDLEEVLRIIRDAFGTERGPRNTILLGFARFHSRYRGEYDRARLIEVLRRKTLNLVGAEGADLAKALGIQTADGVGQAILRAYNHRLSEHHRLPAWDARTQRARGTRQTPDA